MKEKNQIPIEKGTQDGLNLQPPKIDYKLLFISETSKSFCGCQISNDEQYLAFGGTDQIVRIYDVQSNKMLIEIRMRGYCKSLTFTQDSKYLILGLAKGVIKQYDVNDNFSQIWYKKIHSNYINKIIPLVNQHIITCSFDKSIIKTNLVNKQQIWILNEISCVFTVEYIQESDIVISGSLDKTIKFWNCQDQTTIISKQIEIYAQIIQLQLINQSKNLFSLSLSGQLNLWKIDLENKDLIKIKEFTDPFRIFNFYSTDDQNLIIISERYLKILDREGSIIYQIMHEAGSNFQDCDCKQLNNLNYIWIRSQNKIFIAQNKFKQ